MALIYSDRQCINLTSASYPEQTFTSVSQRATTHASPIGLFIPIELFRARDIWALVQQEPAYLSKGAEQLSEFFTFFWSENKTCVLTRCKRWLNIAGIINANLFSWRRRNRWVSSEHQRLVLHIGPLTQVIWSSRLLLLAPKQMEDKDMKFVHYVVALILSSLILAGGAAIAI